MIRFNYTNKKTVFNATECWTFFFCVLFFMQSRKAAQLKGLSSTVQMQPEAYSFHFRCERTFTFAKNIAVLLTTNKQAQPRWEHVTHK